MHERRARAPGAASRPAAGARARRVRAALPAARAAERRRRSRGVEALLRWRHPDARPDPAGRLHPVRRGDRADRPDRPLGAARGLPPGRRSCARSVAGRSRRSTIGINLSVKQLHPQRHRRRRARRARRRRGWSPSALTLEITESVMMTDTDLAVQRLTELQGAGRAHGDGRLRHRLLVAELPQPLPVDILKMDRSLLAAGASPVTSGLATAVIGLGETLRAGGRRRGHRVLPSSRPRCATSAASSARASTSRGRWSTSS